MKQGPVTPLLVGTFVQRSNSGASTIVLGLLLTQIAIRSTHSINVMQIGLLPVAFYVSELTLAPTMGALSDRWGRRNFLILGPLIGLMQALLLFFTPYKDPLVYLLALQVLAGVSGAMTTPAVLGYLADFTAQGRGNRMRIMSLYELVTSGGIAVGTVVGGVAWDHLGRLTFVLLAVGYLLVSFCMFLTPSIPQHTAHGNVRTVAMRYWRIIRMPRLFIFLPAWLCINALVGVWLSSQVAFLLSSPSHHPHQLLLGSLHAGWQLSLVMGGFVLFFGICLLFWAFFLGRLPRIRLMLTSVVGIYLVCVALFGINHRGLGHDRLLLVWIPILLIGICAETSFAPAALSYLADISEDAARDRGLVMGLYSIFLGLGQILGNGLGGVFAHQFGFDGLIYFTALLGFVALCSLLWLFSREKALQRTTRSGKLISRQA